MQTKKSLLLVFALFLCASVAVKAQTAPRTDSVANLKTSTPEQRAKMQTDLMKNKLSLTDQQYPRVNAINLEYARKIDPIFKSDISRYSKYRKIKPLLDEKDGKLKGVLTDDQYKKYQQVKQELMDEAKKRMQGAN